MEGILAVNTPDKWHILLGELVKWLRKASKVLDETSNTNTDPRKLGPVWKLVVLAMSVSFQCLMDWAAHHHWRSNVPRR